MTPHNTVLIATTKSPACLNDHFFATRSPAEMSATSIYQEAADYDGVDASGVDLLTASPELEPTIDSPIPDASDQVLPRAPPADDAMPRAPPIVADSADYLLSDGNAVANGNGESLTQEQLDAAFLEAINRWFNYSLAAGLTGLLDSITVLITDLEDAALGASSGNTIYIDTTAAGYGWFIDGTPSDDAEFTLSEDGRLLAAANGEAFDRIDLLTVLVHEIGHVLGFGHDASLAPMADTLGTGQRALLSSAPRPPGGQIVYLDLDGVAGITYDGPVTISDIELSPFAAPQSMAGTESEIVAAMLDFLAGAFAGSGVVFTTDEPGEGSNYSTIYIGGDGAAFEAYGPFVGLSEKIDVGNEDRNDIAFVFSDVLEQSLADALETFTSLANFLDSQSGTLAERLVDYARELAGYCPTVSTKRISSPRSRERPPGFSKRSRSTTPGSTDS